MGYKRLIFVPLIVGFLISSLAEAFYLQGSSPAHGTAKSRSYKGMVTSIQQPAVEPSNQTVPYNQNSRTRVPQRWIDNSFSN